MYRSYTQPKAVRIAAYSAVTIATPNSVRSPLPTRIRILNHAPRALSKPIATPASGQNSRAGKPRVRL